MCPTIVRCYSQYRNKHAPFGDYVAHRPNENQIAIQFPSSQNKYPQIESDCRSQSRKRKDGDGDGIEEERRHGLRYHGGASRVIHDERSQDLGVGNRKLETESRRKSPAEDAFAFFNPVLTIRPVLFYARGKAGSGRRAARRCSLA